MPRLLELQPVFQFVIDFQGTKDLMSLTKKYQLPENSLGELQGLVVGIINGDAQLANLPGALMAKFGIDDPTSKKLACDITGLRLLPLALFMGGVREAIVEWGGDPDSYHATILQKEKVSPERLVEEFARKIKLDLPEHLLKRFGLLAKGFLLGERDRDATVLMLKRQVNIGGLELSDDQALKALELLEEEKKNVNVVAFEESTQVETPAAVGTLPATSSPITEPVVESAPEPVLPPDRFMSRAEMMTALSMFDDVVMTASMPEEEQQESGESRETGESRAIEQPASKPVTTTPDPHDTPDSHDSALAEVPTKALTTSVPIIAGEMIHEEEKREIEAQKKKIASQGIAAPGNRSTAKDINAALEPATAVFKRKRIAQKTLKDLAAAFIKGVRDYIPTQQMLTVDLELSEKDSQVVLQAFESARKLQESGGSRESRAVEKPASMPATTTPDPRDSHDPLDPSLPRVSAARTADEEAALRAKRPIAVVPAKPEKAVAMVTAVSLPPTTQPMSDVKFAPKLMGPVEELGAMSIDALRRLSSDPALAAKKVLDKLDVLESTSYGQRVAGVKAWRTSPLNQLYLDMTRQALQDGVSLTETATKRRNDGLPSMSPAEMKAIVDLNSRIKF